MGESLTRVARGLKGAMNLLFPPRCMACGEGLAGDAGFCGPCWRDLRVISGLACDCCGEPLAGEGEQALCESCATTPRPWARGQAAFVYSGTGRRLALALKFHDRLDLVKPLSAMLLKAGQPLLRPEMLVAPVPMHPSRLFARRYNQAALLSRALARQARLEHIPDLLTRLRATPPQEGLTATARQENVAGSFAATPRFKSRFIGRHVLLVDDVLTTGATLTACTEACLAAGALKVSVLVLARVAREG